MREKAKWRNTDQLVYHLFDKSKEVMEENREERKMKEDAIV